MAPKSIFLLALIIPILNSINAEKTKTSTVSTSQLSTSIPDSFDTSIGGNNGNPGAQLRFSTKALDEVYKHAVTMIKSALKSMNIPDVIVPVGGGMLTIKNVRISDAKIPNFDRQLIPPNKIKSRLSNARLVSIGEWHYKTVQGQRSTAQGIFRTVVVNAEMNVTNQLSRTWDAKPMVQTNDCKAYLGEFRVEIEGFGDNTTVIDQCTNLLCQRIRAYFEDAVCNCARNYIKDTINQKLSTFPTRIYLGNGGNRFVLKYDLLNGEPKVTDQFIQGYLEGEVLSRGVGSTPFHAAELSPINVTRQKMISFLISDFAFNSLFHHAQGQQFKYSAFEMINQTSPIKELLRLNCSTPVNSRHQKKFSFGTGTTITGGRGQLCLGSVFENYTSQYPADSMGDLVFKTQRPLAAFVRHPQKSYFGTNAGSIEVFGPIGNDGRRDLLGRADVQMLRGDFFPKMDGANVTASINITELQLAQSSPAPIQARIRSMPDQVLTKLAQLSTPLINEMLNMFMDQFGQFPIPMIDGYECEKPEFRWSQRTMQIDCDLRVIASESTKTEKRIFG